MCKKSINEKPAMLVVIAVHRSLIISGLLNLSPITQSMNNLLRCSIANNETEVPGRYSSQIQDVRQEHQHFLLNQRISLGQR